MQNNITEITQKLLGALDGNYNVTNMATIIEVITQLEKVTITKEMLETTRLGKHINELRKHISNDTLAKRAKLLVKKWRNIVLVTNPPDAQPAPPPPTTNGQIRGHDEPPPVSKKRPPPKLEPPPVKKPRANGVPSAFDYDFSDNSNSSFKDSPIVPKTQQHHVVVVNSDSNSSMPGNEPHYEETQQPKKRGRKKGSKNHKNLIEEAESSFSNKMAVSRGNAKVKTTQELIESLQSRTTCPSAPLTSPAKNLEDWRERAAKLTERVSLIDQKLNSGGRNHKKRNNNKEVSPPPKSMSASNSRPETPDDDDDVEIDVVDDVPNAKLAHLVGLDEQYASMMAGQAHANYIPSLSIEEALGRLPPIDATSIFADDDGEPCMCVLEEHDDDEEPTCPTFRIHDDCPARVQLDEKYRLTKVHDVGQLHAACIANLNGNYGSRLRDEPSRPECGVDDDVGRNLQDVNIVPNFYELPAKRASCSENYKKYSISEEAPRILAADVATAAAADGLYDNNSNSNHSSCNDKPDIKDTATAATLDLVVDDALMFREFHECLDRPSYNGDMLRILPYVVID